MTTIGIDPGMTKSGVAIVEDGKLIAVSYLRLWTLFEYILDYHEEVGHLWVIENSNLTKATFHGATARSNVGKNKAISQTIVDYCKHLGVDYIEVAPHGYSDAAKKHAVLFAQISGFTGKTNEHQRAAYFIAEAGRKQWILNSKKRSNQSK